MTEAALNGRFELRGAPGNATTVRLAWDTQLRRLVVLKWLRDQAADVDRIRILLAAPPHPSLAVMRYDFAAGDETVLVLDHVEGLSLAERMDESSAMPLGDTFRYLAQVAAAIDHLHSLETPVAHGDVKAANVVIAGSSVDRRAVLVDVGTRPAELADDVAAFAALAGELVGHTSASAWQRRAMRRVIRRPVHPLTSASELVGALALAANARPPYRRLSLAAAVLAGLATLNALPTGGVHADKPNRVPEVAAPVVKRVSAPLGPTPVRADFAPLPSGAASTAVAEESPVNRPTVSLRPPRLAVYSAGTELGQFDVFRVDAPGDPAWQYRTTGLLLLWSQIATLGDGWMFFYRSADGVLGTAPVEENGRLGYGDATLAPQPGWTHVTAAGGQVVWLYRRDTGAARVLRFVDGWRVDDDTHVIEGGYDNVVALGDERLLHYQAATGRAAIVSVDRDGRIRGHAQVALPPQWAAIATAGSNHVVGVDSRGRGAVVDLAANPTVLQRFDLRGFGWSRAVGFSGGVAVTSATGATAIVRLSDDGRVDSVRRWSIPVGAVLASVR